MEATNYTDFSHTVRGNVVDLVPTLFLHLLDSFDRFFSLLSTSERNFISIGLKNYLESVATHFPEYTDAFDCAVTSLSSVQDEGSMAKVNEFIKNSVISDALREVYPEIALDNPLTPELFSFLLSLPVSISLREGVSRSFIVKKRSGLLCFADTVDGVLTCYLPRVSHYTHLKTIQFDCGHIDCPLYFGLGEAFLCPSCTWDAIKNKPREFHGKVIEFDEKVCFLYYFVLKNSVHCDCGGIETCVGCGEKELVCGCACSQCFLIYNNEESNCIFCKRYKVTNAVEPVTEVFTDDNYSEDSCFKCRDNSASTTIQEQNFCNQCLFSALETNTSPLSRSESLKLTPTLSLDILLKLQKSSYSPQSAYPCYLCSSVDQLFCCVYCENCLRQQNYCPLCWKEVKYCLKCKSIQKSAESSGIYCEHCVEYRHSQVLDAPSSLPSTNSCDFCFHQEAEIQALDEMGCLACVIKILQAKKHPRTDMFLTEDEFRKLKNELLSFLLVFNEFSSQQLIKNALTLFEAALLKSNLDSKKCSLTQGYLSQIKELHSLSSDKT